MAAHTNTPPHLDEEDIGDEDSLTEDEDANSASTSSSLPTPTSVVTTATPTSSSAHFVTVAVPSVPNASTRPDNQIIALPAAGDRKPFQDDSRKLFQRLWTDEDEMELLRGFSDYTSQRGGTVHWDANLFYDQIRSKLRLEFNKSQLVEKLRRLKKKYKNAVSKISDGKDVAFKSAHDRATFEISGKIWSSIAALVVNGDNMDEDDDEDGNAHHVSSIPVKTPNPNLIPNHNLDPKTEDATFRSRKRQRLPYQSTPENNVNPSSNLVALTEEIVKSSLTPFIKELKNRSHGGGIGGFASAAPFGVGVLEMFDFRMGTGIVGDLNDERWSKQQMLELEVYSKRLDLMQGQIRAKLKELRSNSRR